MSDTANTAIKDDNNRKDVRSKRGRRVLGLVLIVLILLLGLASFLLYRLIAVPSNGTANVDTAGITWIRSIYGMSDAADDQLSRAQDAVTAPDGTLWITDGSHQAIMHFTADGRFIGSITGPEDTPLYSPSRLAVDANGNIYACELTQDVVRVLSEDGQEAGSFGIPQPTSIAVSDDRIVVGAVSGFAILDKKGKPIKVIGSRGKGDDQFDYVHGVAIGENGNIYVSDSFNNRLSAYDPTGKRLWMVRTGKPANAATMVNDNLVTQDASGTALEGDQALQLPLGMTIDGAGRLVVADMFDCSLAVFDSKDGSFIAKYGEVGPEDGQFFYPVSVNYDQQRDWFTVADQMNYRVQIIRLPGSNSTNGAAAALSRVLAGPLRACIFPFLLLVLAIIVWLVARAVRKRRAAAAAAAVTTPAAEIPNESPVLENDDDRIAT